MEAFIGADDGKLNPFGPCPAYHLLIVMEWLK
jgi:hypothetical protein